MIHNVTVTGAGTTQTLAQLMIASGNYTADSANKMRLNWLQAITESGGVARIGDVNTSVSNGFAIPSTYGGDQLPPVHQPGHSYSTTSIYFYIPNGAVLDLMWDA
jgi:hypothetical protein